ncbi:pregnancy-specific glycoprotein 22-like isoform X3 [Chelonia mydas]|uniref:pregnancy-specific glycoprotein 22-like isoform X3 n=1 Tax=Chelonia mydas TaxID=8469 RepID=UPI001CA8241F|nr:pregnancy-specific glycoprotein 22-like isoform X3 [Chelonia mydas]
MGRIPHRPGGPWTGILLAASVLGSCLQPVPAQTPVTIVLTPPSPAVGGGVSLAPQNPPQDFVLCSWFRSATATDGNSQILTYYPQTPPVQTKDWAHTGRETAGPGCALHIAGLTLKDTGNYTVLIQSPTRPVLATVHLPVSASVLGSCLQPAPAQTPVTIVLTPPSPAMGGGVSLAPQNPPQDFVLCSWFRSATATDGNSQILTYYPQTPPVQTKDWAHTGRETAGPGCALHIAGLTLKDTGNYTVLIQSPTRPVLATVHLPVSASVLGSCLQPAPAQTPVTIVLTPPSPAMGGGVSLAPQNPPQDFVLCSWFRSATATDGNSQILTYYPQTPPVQTKDWAHTGRETAGPGCALHIAGLTLKDTGNYTVLIQSPTRPVLATVHLPVSASVLGSCLQPAPAQTPVTIVLTPPSPAMGGGVSLAPQNPPQDFVLCSWFRSATATDGNSQILTYYPQTPPVQTKDRAHTGRETAGPGCALHIAGLTLKDTGNYTVLIQSLTRPVLATVHLPVSDTPRPGLSAGAVVPRPGLSAGAVAGIVIGSLAGAALVGVGAYFLYSRCRNETPRENGAPVLVYENLPLAARAGPVTLQP